MNEKEISWKITDNRFVAFVDILGFKDKVMRTAHKELYNEMIKISDIIKGVEFFQKDDFLSRYSNSDVYIVSFSDSIVIFSKSNSNNDLEHFLIVIRFLFANCIRKGIPLKGGAAYGEISLNKQQQIYIGQPIIDAYLLQEEVNYLGIAFHNSIDRYISEIKKPSKHLNKFFFEYKTPLKSGKICHKNLDWFYMAKYERKNYYKDISQEDVLEILEVLNLNVSGNPRKYIDNTIELFNELNNRKLVNVGLVNITEL